MMEDKVDVFVVGQVVLPELGALVRKEEKKRGREINYTVMSEADFKYRKANRDPFVSQLLTQPRIMIVGDDQDMIDY